MNRRGIPCLTLAEERWIRWLMKQPCRVKDGSESKVWSARRIRIRLEELTGKSVCGNTISRAMNGTYSRKTMRGNVRHLHKVPSILKLTREGLSRREISERLLISKETVSTYRRRFAQ